MRRGADTQQVDFAQLIDPTCVLILEATPRDQILEQLIAKLDAAGKIQDPGQMLEAVQQRELLASTGIGLGVAIPHAKLPNMERFCMAVAIVPNGVDWEAVDGEPCQLVFLIAGPESDSATYLQILSRVTGLLRDAARRHRLIHASTPDEVLAALLS